MNPGHEALRLVRELVATIDDMKGTALFRAMNPRASKLYDRARGVLAASGGLDGNGVRRPSMRVGSPEPDPHRFGWCCSCGAYHELTGDPSEVLA